MEVASWIIHGIWFRYAGHAILIIMPANGHWRCDLLAIAAARERTTQNKIKMELWRILRL